MRLSPQELKAIKQCLAEFFPNSQVYLFGSRIDDNKKGGDIDLYIETKLDNIFKRKTDFSNQLKSLIGGQKLMS